MPRRSGVPWCVGVADKSPQQPSRLETMRASGVSSIVTCIPRGYGARCNRPLGRSIRAHNRSTRWRRLCNFSVHDRRNEQAVIAKALQAEDSCPSPRVGVTFANDTWIVVRSSLLVVCASAALGACAYEPNSLLRPSSDRVGRQLGCVDTAVAVTSDPAAVLADPVVRVEFGNRCDRRADIDLGALEITATYVDGLRQRLHPYDPNGELRRLPIDARGHGYEIVEFVAPTGETTAPIGICVDVRSIAPSEGALPLGASCFGQRGDRIAPLAVVTP